MIIVNGETVDITVKGTNAVTVSGNTVNIEVTGARGATGATGPQGDPGTPAPARLFLQYRWDNGVVTELKNTTGESFDINIGFAVFEIIHAGEYFNGKGILWSSTCTQYSQNNITFVENNLTNLKILIGMVEGDQAWPYIITIELIEF